GVSMSSRVLVIPALAVFASIAAAACGGSPESKAEAPAAAPAADHSGHTGGGRVFFMEPANGATVKSPVHLVFASEAVTIAPVPQGEVTEVRPNTAHYHLGVDTDCLPVGAGIPK